MFFPESPKFRRGVQIVAISLCMMATFDILFFEDFGGQKHAFTAFRTWAYPKFDRMYGITDDELRKTDRNKILFNFLELKEKK
jgi:hypothetical protein